MSDNFQISVDKDKTISLLLESNLQLLASVDALIAMNAEILGSLTDSNAQDVATRFLAHKQDFLRVHAARFEGSNAD